MESYGAHSIEVTDSGGRPAMDGIRARVRARGGWSGDQEAMIVDIALGLGRARLASRQPLHGAFAPL